jgi:IclR family acetate operon transcriptional repressor
MTLYRNQSLERGFGILEYLGASITGQSVSQVAQATGLHRATAHRLLEVLCRLGYAYKGDDHRYWVGFQLHRFGHKPSMIARITHHAHPYLVALAHEVDETVNLGALEGIQAFIADRVVTDRSLRLDVQVGDYFDAHATSIGKALLSLHRPEEVRSIYERAPLRAHTANTTKTVTALLRELARVRTRGYAINDGEMTPGVRSIAVPLLNPEQRALCAIAVTGPTARMSDDRMARLCVKIQETAAQIVDQLVVNPSG